MRLASLVHFSIVSGEPSVRFMTLVRGRCDDVTRAFAPGAACDGDGSGLGERRDVSIGISSRDEYVGEHRGGAQAGFDAVTHREAQHAGEEDRAGRSERGDHGGWFFLETGRLTPWFARVRSDGGAGALIHLFISGVVFAVTRPLAGSEISHFFQHIFSKRANGDTWIFWKYSRKID